MRNEELLSKGTTYEDIKKYADEEQLAMIKVQAQVCTYEGYKKEELKEIQKDINIAVFVENRCGDAQTMVPILKEITKVNDKIKLSYFEASKYDAFLIEKVGEKKVPMILFLRGESEVSSVYNEFPIKVRALIEANPDNREFIVKEEFRKGKYNIEVEKDIVEAILGV